MQGRHPLQTSEALGAAAVQLGPHAVALAARINKQFGVSFGKNLRAVSESLRAARYPQARWSARCIGAPSRRSARPLLRARCAAGAIDRARAVTPNKPVIVSAVDAARASTGRGA
ncbi:MAG: hypothetical protein WD227_16280 [Vicinamibacterales bacterium]